jgi:hypothetical protein
MLDFGGGGNRSAPESAARLPQKTDSFRQGILLTGESGDKTATANFAACLEDS